MIRGTLFNIFCNACVYTTVLFCNVNSSNCCKLLNVHGAILTIALLCNSILYNLLKLENVFATKSTILL